MTFGDTVEGVLRLSGRIVWRTALLVALVIGPFQLVSSYLVARVVPETLTPGALLGDQPVLAPGDLLERFGIWTVVLQVVGLLVHLLVLTAAVGFVLQEDRGEPQHTTAALRFALDRSGATVGGSVLLLTASFALAVLVVPLGVVLTAVPAVGSVLAVGVALLLAAVVAGGALLVVPIAATHDLGAWTTFRGVVAVVRRRPGRLLGGVGLVVVALLVGLLVSIPAVVLLSVLGLPGWVADGVVSTLVTVVGLPVAAVAGLLVAHDARRRTPKTPAGPRR